MVESEAGRRPSVMVNTNNILPIQGAFTQRFDVCCTVSQGWYPDGAAGIPYNRADVMDGYRATDGAVWTPPNTA